MQINKVIQQNLGQESAIQNMLNFSLRIAIPIINDLISLFLSIFIKMGKERFKHITWEHS